MPALFLKVATVTGLHLPKVLYHPSAILLIMHCERVSITTFTSKSLSSPPALLIEIPRSKAYIKVENKKCINCTKPV